MKFYEAENVSLLLGDCVEQMSTLPDASVDAVVTDPPAGIGFMGKAWDHDKGGRDQWIGWMTTVASEALRVAKPGAHALVWAIPRTSHWTAKAWEDAGWIVRDRVTHINGAGFPKSRDVSKDIDRMAGAERTEVIGTRGLAEWKDGAPAGVAIKDGMRQPFDQVNTLLAPATDAARQWQGFGTALKPAAEDWWLLRKPLSEGTVAANVLRHGTGALNVDACRIGTEQRFNGAACPAADTFNASFDSGYEGTTVAGRWPANVTLDEAGAALLDSATGELTSGDVAGSKRNTEGGNGVTHGGMSGVLGRSFADSGGASRFFYVAKSSRSEREAGLDGFTAVTGDAETAAYGDGFRDGPGSPDRGTREDYVYKSKPRRNDHPTVKSIDLMRWLCRLITPPRVAVVVCADCEQDLPRVPADVRAEASRSAPLQPPVPADNGGASTPTPAHTVPDVRQDADERAGEDVLQRPVQFNSAAEAEDLRGVWGDVPGAQADADDVLSQVRGNGDAEASAPVPAMWRGVPAGEERRSDLLHAGVRGEMDRNAPEELQGPTSDGGGLHQPPYAGSPDGDADGLSTRTPARDGAAVGPDADRGRSGGSHQRREGRQPSGEPAGTDEARARQPAEAPEEADRVPPLRRDDRAVRTCPNCGSPLTQTDRPGVILDPFLGSGSTALAALDEGFRCIGIERDEHSMEIARHRITHRHLLEVATVEPTAAQPMGRLL